MLKKYLQSLHFCILPELDNVTLDYSIKMDRRLCKTLLNTERTNKRFVYISCNDQASMKSYVDLCRATRQLNLFQTNITVNLFWCWSDNPVSRRFSFR